MKILKNKKMHKFRKSVKISLVKTCTVSFHCFKSCSQSTVSQKNHQGSHFLPFHLFNFSTFTFFKVFSSFFQCLGASYLMLGTGPVAKASCSQIILYILHFARFPILIFKFNFAISSFSNFLRNVKLKWFHFIYLSHTTKSVIMAIIFWQTKQNHFELFSCRKVSNTLPKQNLHNTFLLIFFISDLIRDEKICILLSTYFSTLMRSDMVLTSNFNFPFVTSTPFSMCFALDVEITHSKRILSFFALLKLMNDTIKFFRLFFFIFFENGRPTTVNTAHFGLLLF